MLLRVILAGLVALSVSAGPAAADPNDSDLYAWGANGAGQLGDGTNEGRQRPVKVNTSGVLAGKRIQSVSGGGYHSCVIAEGTVYCWGSNNQGQLGRSTGAGTEPGPVAGLLEGRTVTAVSAGHQHTCAVADGQLFCWGWNQWGQLGTGAPTANSPTPIAVMTSGALAGKTITSVTAGWANTCATDSDSDVYCWGAGSIMSNAEPTLEVDGAGGPVTSLRTSEEHACYVQNARAYCGGLNADGEVGNGNKNATSWTAVNTAGVLNQRTLTAIRVGTRFSCALADAKPFCWGNNYYGQLGIGVAEAPPSAVPVEVLLPPEIADKPVAGLTAGERFSCLIADGQPYCWGENEAGQIGDGSNTVRPSPTAVDDTGELAGKQARTFSAGANHVLFLAQQVPTTPGNVAASVNGSEATVSWQRPKDDGGRPVTGYRVTGGSGCETTGLSCTVSALAPGSEIALHVVARNGVGDSAPATVTVKTDPAPVPLVVKGKQSVSAPKRIKKRGITVIVKKGAKTDAGQPVTTKVKTKGKVKLIRKKGAIKVRTFGKKGWRVVVTQTAPGTDTHEPFSQRVVYVNGKRRVG